MFNENFVIIIRVRQQRFLRLIDPFDFGVHKFQVTVQSRGFLSFMTMWNPYLVIKKEFNA
ncbi:7249_t:CDS:2 [Funneliformis geosporum]|uniref:2278_t:CDS:1 n=1 Tax=Funneliformis geosporum TaxID=1117311 RepID=A0A9W4WR82_9GLOM|nr:7249_t:CDS:2 [Funneliformis geosporum]CAI2172920.1 2278_t:CDS:2 [Funneliformis geosporum]